MRENKRKETKAGPCLGNFKMVCHTIENDMSSIKFIIFMLICFWCKITCHTINFSLIPKDSKLLIY